MINAEVRFINMNKYIYRFIAISLTVIFILFLASCRSKNSEFEDIHNFNIDINQVVDQNLFTTTLPYAFTDDEEDFVESSLNDFKTWNRAYVVFENGGATIENTVSNTEIFMQNGDLIVNSTQKMTLVVKGTLNGSIHVFKPDGKFQLILDGINITANSGPAINLQTESRSFIVINEGTVNNVTDANFHPPMSDGSNTKAAIFSEEQLIISGNGTLNITALYRHGITSDDYIRILSGNINIISTIADGLHANDYIIIDGGVININAENEGIECERGYIVINGGQMNIQARNGIQTSYDGDDVNIDSKIVINHGLIHIAATRRGIESIGKVQINDGAVLIESENHAIHADQSVSIHGGLHVLNSGQRRAINANEDVLITKGTVLALSDGDEASIRSRDGDIHLMGGTIVAAGALDIPISNTSQTYIKMGNIQSNEVIAVNKNISLVMIGFQKRYTHLVISSELMEKNTTYEIYTGGQVQGPNLYGFYFEGAYTGGFERHQTKSQ
jgi:hypothetical protein